MLGAQPSQSLNASGRSEQHDVTHLKTASAGLVGKLACNMPPARAQSMMNGRTYVVIDERRKGQPQEDRATLGNSSRLLPAVIL